MPGELGEQPRDDAQPVGAPVEREVRPAVRVTFGGRRREVRRIGEDPLEPTEPAGEVGPHRVDRQAFLPRRST